MKIKYNYRVFFYPWGPFLTRFMQSYFSRVCWCYASASQRFLLAVQMITIVPKCRAHTRVPIQEQGFSFFDIREMEIRSRYPGSSLTRSQSQAVFIPNNGANCSLECNLSQAVRLDPPPQTQMLNL